MTWPEPTTGMTQPPTPIWQTLSGVLPATGCSPRSRCSTGLEIKRSTYVDNLILNLHLKPRFQWQFAMQSDDKLIINGLSNLPMKPNESTGKLLARITNTMVIIKESYATYEKKVAARPITMPMGATWRPPPQNGGTTLLATPCSFSKCSFSGQHCQGTSTRLLLNMIQTPWPWTTCIRLPPPLRERLELRRPRPLQRLTTRVTGQWKWGQRNCCLPEMEAFQILGQKEEAALCVHIH